jgi:hypothetical protein
MASDAFIKTDGVSGEALAYKHKTWIEIDGYQFGSRKCPFFVCGPLWACRQAGPAFTRSA